MPALSSIPPVFSPMPFIFSFVIIVSLTIFARTIHILPGFSPRPPRKEALLRPSHIVIVLGSGGHTAEMISMLRYLDPRRYAYRTYIVSSGDVFSSSKAIEFEVMMADRYKLKFKGVKKVSVNCPGEDIGKHVGEETNKLDQKDSVYSEHIVDDGDASIKLAKDGGEFEIITVPRAREIHQPLYTAPFSSLACFWACLSALRSSSWSTPDMIIVNGPATAVIVVFAALILRFLGFEGRGEMKTVYVESWARVKTLSLSGRILQWGLVDRFLVQWEGLKGGNREYQGVLVE